MKALVTTAMLFLSTLLPAQSNPTLIFHGKGASADINLILPDGTQLSLEGVRGSDDTGSPSTLLLYTAFSFSSDSITETFAAATIPNEAFRGDDAAHLVLDVDTSQLTDFSAQTCVFSFIDFTETCGPAALGVIQFEWRQNRAFTQHIVSDRNTTDILGREHEHQESDSASADVTGSFLGLPVSASFGNVNTAHNTVIEIFRTH